METQTLAGPDSVRDWAPAESEIRVAPGKGSNGAPALHWHIAVDYFAGEAKYPVGWPRVSVSLNEKFRDWSDWEFVEFNVLTESSRTNLPREPVTLAVNAPDRNSALHHVLDEIEIGRWKHVRIPVSELKSRDNVRSFQFSISESQYRHGDTLDLFIDRIVLTRYRAPTVASFAPENSVIFSGAVLLPLRVEMLGVKAAASSEVAFTVSRDHEVILTTTNRVTRGAQRVAIRMREPLAAGNYQVTASAPADSEIPRATLRVINSPFQ